MADINVFQLEAFIVVLVIKGFLLLLFHKTPSALDFFPLEKANTPCKMRRRRAASSSMKHKADSCYSLEKH